MKAYKLLQANYNLPPMNIHLHKVIPIGAGLGGGSSDAAFTIKTINQLFGLGMSEKSMQDYASQIGSDCPFFIRNKPMLVAGRGERLTPAQVSLSGKYLVMVFPNIHVSTQEAYSKVKPKLPALSCEAVLRLPIAQWKELLVNDFEKPLFDMHPKLAEIKQELYDMGAVYASMSGSGSSIYGIFTQMPTDRVWENCQTFGTWLP
jgi:4-diphosphocytidyl-2-C-methyl-D-erythritol kinase